jgi:DedD protein
LFSFLGKNKQDSSAKASGRYSSADNDAFAERARAKRASHAGGGARKAGADDPVLPEKKRARRRLVGAVALALAAAVGLPMLLDSEPRPLAGDVAIQIPAKDKAAPLPMPSAPAAVAASDSVDKGEEIVAAAPAKAAAPAADSARTVTEVKPAARPEPAAPVAERAKPEPPKPEHKDKPSKAEPKSEPKEKAVRKEDKKEDKPARAAAPAEGARAMAILEGKDAARAREAAGQKYVMQVAALSSQEKVAELQARLRESGIHSFTQRHGELIRVKVGPFSREEAEKVRVQLGKLGLSGALTPS